MLMTSSDTDLARFIEPVARALLGDPNLQLSNGKVLRFGSHGSMSVDLEKGTAYSHEEKVGGGVLWLLERERKLRGKAAFDFLRDLGCDLDEPKPPERSKIVATYDYHDETGKLLFQVCRFEPKDFRQRAPNGDWKVKGIRQVPYRLPEIIEAVAMDRTVFIVEGEKDADNLARWNIPATCNAGGAGKWRADFARLLAGASVVVVPDNDKAGRDHAEMVCASLASVANEVRYLTLPGLPEKGDVSDWIRSGGSPETLHALVERAPIWTQRVESKFGGLRWEQIAPTSAASNYAWAVEDVIPLGEITLAFGDSGTGKSFDMFDMSMCVSRGLPFNGKNVEPGLVIYVAAEAGKGFNKRKLAYVQHHQIGDQALPFYLMTKRPDFFGSDTDVENLIAEIKAIAHTYREKLVLIVLDTLSALAPGMNENASADVSRVRARLVRIAETFADAAIVLVHHKPKGGSTPRGHGSLTADFETTIEFEDTGARNSLGLRIHRGTVRKQREGKSGMFWDFTLPVVQVGQNKWGNPETSCVVVPWTEKRATASGGFHATPTEKLFMESLFEALNTHGVRPPQGLPPSITRAVDIAHVREVMRSRVITGEEDQGKADGRFRTAFSRAGDVLRRGQVIGFAKPLIWFTGKPVNGISMVTFAPVEIDP